MKLITLLLVTGVLLVSAWIWATVTIVKEVQTVGLKSIVESVWYGKAQEK